MKTSLKKRTSQNPIRVLLIEDHAVLRQSLKTVLNAEPDITVVGEAGDRAGGLALIGQIPSDILIQDICLGQDDGLKLLHEAKLIAPALRCLVLTGYAENDFIMRAIRHHADGYLMKTCAMPHLLSAIRQVADGHKVWDHIILTRLAGIDAKAAKQAHDTGIESLTPIEFKIAGFIAEGLTNGEIGKRIHLAEKTIRNRVSIIMDKLQVTRRSRIAALYTRSRPHFDQRKSLSLNDLSPSMTRK